MSHIHEKIDFTIGVFVVFEGKVLLVEHKTLKKWLPLGGHIELDEEPVEAAIREVKEESGLDVELIGGEVPAVERSNGRFLLPPIFMDIHQISDTHQHIGLCYFARAKTGKVALAEQEHNAIKWFSEAELDDVCFGLTLEIKFYAREALRRAT